MPPRDVPPGAGCDADVAVVGAGPAGAWAAYRLARGGARVVLFDPSHPREKPCGGGVTARALRLVGNAVPRDDIGAVAIRRALFIDASGNRADVPLGDEAGHSGGAPLVVASRARFDGALLAAAQRAGATLVRQRVSAVTADRSTVALTTAAGSTVRASFVIGADGANSLVRRRLSRPFERRQLSIATGYFAEGATSDTITLELVADPPGYIWSFPRTDHLAIGICAQADGSASAAALRDRVRRWIADTGIAPGATLRAYSWPIPSLSQVHCAAAQAAGRRWMLAGDAAGLVDPITREGIFFALQSAGYAADALLSAAASPARYVECLRADVLPELERAAAFKAGFFTPRFTALLMEGLRTSAPLRGVMADLIAGEQSYRTLKWRLFRTCEWRLALRALRSRGTIRR